MNELATTKWYKHLILNIEELYVETKYNMGEDLVHYYHLLGELIIKDNGNFEREKVYDKKILERVRISLEQREKPIVISISSLYRAKQFYSKFPDWENFVSTYAPDKKGITWHDVCQKCLPLPKDMKEEKPKPTDLDKVIRLIEKLPLPDLLVVQERVNFWISEKELKNE